MAEPFDGLGEFRSIKRVLAGEITEVVAVGCYVLGTDGRAVLRRYPPGRSAYPPKVGDFWIVYDAGRPTEYQSISPRAAFLEGYVPVRESDA